jgi:hypothetical protein
METGQTQQGWSELQIKYADFVARGKTTLTGERKTDEEFAQAHGINRTTMWRWTQQDGWPALLMDRSLKWLASQIPAMNRAQVGKANGEKKYKDASYAAYKVIMQQYELMKSDKVDITSAGKPLPQPVMDLSALRDQQAAEAEA